MMTHPPINWGRAFFFSFFAFRFWALLFRLGRGKLDLFAFSVHTFLMGTRFGIRHVFPSWYMYIGDDLAGIRQVGRLFVGVYAVGAKVICTPLYAASLDAGGLSACVPACLFATGLPLPPLFWTAFPSPFSILPSFLVG